MSDGGDDVDEAYALKLTLSEVVRTQIFVGCEKPICHSIAYSRFDFVPIKDGSCNSIPNFVCK